MTSRTFESFQEGETASWTRQVDEQDLAAFVRLSGDTNPLHVDAEFARKHGFRDQVVHGMLVSAFVSKALGTVLPGAGTLWLSQNSKFLQPVYLGDCLEVRLRITHKSEGTRILVIETNVVNQRGETVLRGEAKVTHLSSQQGIAYGDLTVIVTGASRGIGRAVAQAFGRQGSRVVVNFRERRDSAEEVVDLIKVSGGEATAVQADVSTVEGVQALSEAATKTYGPIHVVVGNATPVIRRKPFTETSWEEIDCYWNAYVRSSFALAQTVLPSMKEQKFGRIIHLLTSYVSGTPPAEMIGYVTAKSALWGFTRALAAEVAQFGVTVNAISPSPIMTEQWDDVPESRRRALAVRSPLRRLGTPEDVAQAVLYLAGPGGSFVTGTNIPVAGGEIM